MTVGSGNPATIYYDGMGNVTSNGMGLTLTYGVTGRMIMEWSAALNTGVSMLYNGLNELAWTRTYTYGACSGVEVPIVREFYTFAPDGRALELLSENASETFADYIWLDDVPVAQIRDTYDEEGTYMGSETTYLHADYLGTPRVGTDESKNVTWRYDSDAFGNGTPVGTANVRLRFPGQVDLGLEGIRYNYYRDYDPGTGRYVESDPIGLQGGINTYSYGAANPLSHIDPTGLDCTAVGGTVTCTPPGGPTISFPRPPTWPDYIGPNSWNYHSYNESANTSGASKECLDDYIRNHPTPGYTPQNPATPQGVGNNATPSNLSAFGASPVLSYLTTSNGTQVVVNVTLPGHPLFPGYVARTVQPGSNSNQLNNYGEGSGLPQASWIPILPGFINNAWQQANDAAYKACSCQH